MAKEAQIHPNLRLPIVPHIMIELPCLPPSVNHYKVRYRSGNTVVTDEAKKFKLDLATLSTGCVCAKTYYVHITLTPGPKHKGDIDNYCKLVLDGLKDAGIITTDAAVKSLHVDLFDSPESRKNGPKTRIFVADNKPEVFHKAIQE